MPRERSQSLTVYLRRTGLGGLSNWLRDPGNVHQEAVSIPGATEGVLVAKASNPHTPEWLEFVRPCMTSSMDSLPNMLQSSASAVLLLKVGGRQFGIPFGQGHHLLRDDQCVHDFGIKVVLNAVDSEQLKSVGVKSIDEASLRTKRDSSRGSTIGTFGLDPTSDLLREVAGVPGESSGFTRLAGSTSVSVAAKVGVLELPDLAKSLLKFYKGTAYRKDFEWLDYFRPVDPSIVKRLDGQLIADLNANQLTYAHLAPPHQLEWENVEGFTFSTVRGSNDLMPDPRISRYLATVPPGDLTIDRLKDDTLQVYDAPSGSRRYNWSMHRCIVYEHRDGEKRFVLSEGQWYEVDGQFAKRVLRYVREIEPLQASLPQSVTDENEFAYNKRAAASIGAACMDRELITGNGFGAIELCDLFTKQGQMLHVKRRSGSSTLSHLFAQGVVCAELLCDEDPAFRKAARKKLRSVGGASLAAIVPEDRPDARTLEVAYVILTRGHQSNRNPYTLPFFSMVSLMNSCKRLRALSFNVSIIAVDEQPASP